jgi:hypothetical protein
VARVEYQMKVEDVTPSGGRASGWLPQSIEPFIPTGVKWEPDPEHSPYVSFHARGDAITVRENILRTHPQTSVRIWAQPIPIEDEADFLDENTGNCCLDEDGVFVKRER